MRRASAFPRHDLPEFRIIICPRRIQRAQGMPGDGLTHGPPATKNAGGSYHRSSRFNPTFPAQWCSGLYVLSPVRRACWPPSPVRRAMRVFTDLTSASGGQDHTISPSACTSHVRRSESVHRIPHNVRDDRDTPLCRERGIARIDHTFLKNGSKIFGLSGVEHRK
jgi:hypothetical protein